MSKDEILEVRKQLESAKSTPEKALAIVIMSVERIASHLESERENRQKMNESIIGVEKVLNGWRGENGKKYPGFLDSVDELKAASVSAKAQSEKNAGLIWKLIIAIVAGLALQLLAILAGKIHFG